MTTTTVRITAAQARALLAAGNHLLTDDPDATMPLNGGQLNALEAGCERVAEALLSLR